MFVVLLVANVAAVLAASASASGAPGTTCANGNNATGDSLCGCVAEGQALSLACVGPAGSQGGSITGVAFASFGTPSTAGGCGHFAAGGCAGDASVAMAAVATACVGKATCSIAADAHHLNGGKDPCPGVVKSAAIQVTCSDPQPPAPPPAPPAPPPPKPGMYSPCGDPASAFSKQAWCDPAVAMADRVSDMLQRMATEDKLQYLMIRSPPAPSLGLPAYNWWEEATHGVTPQGRQGDATNTAFPITTAMSFNRTLWRETGRLIGTEARALMNMGKAGSDFWAPVVNLARDGRWGRNLETPGEDPYVSGEYATEFVQGFQRAPGDDGAHLLASACCKHYVANSVEHSSENGLTWDRFEVDSVVTQQDLVDSYMPAFQACVEKGKVSGLMCSLNAVNGVPACANDWLMNEVARGDWGFDGYVTTDCDGYQQSYQFHNYSGSPEEGVRDMLRAGLDVDCAFGPGVTLDIKTVHSAFKLGVITLADVDTALRHLFTVRMRLGHFDPPGPLQKIPASVICSAEHNATARAGAAQGSTLLKNVGKTLPLSPSVASVAVIGPNGDLSRSIAGYYGANRPCGGRYSTMVDAVAQYVPRTTFVKGVPGVSSTDTSGIANATAIAKASGATVLVVGTDLGTAHEGHDATDLTLSPAQLELVGNVSAAAAKPVVVVVMSAVPLDLTPLLANPKVGAILYVGQPSVQCLGVGDVLFGKSAPAGRLVQTLYPVEVQHQLSIFDMNMRPGPSKFARPDGQGCKPGTKVVPCSSGTNVGKCTPDVDCVPGTNPGRTHRFYTGKAVVPFGYGLSYSTFTYKITAAPTSAAPVPLDAVHGLLASTRATNRSFPQLALAGDRDSAPVQYTVEVTNTGSIDSDDVVLGFMTPPNAGQGGVPLQTLFGFERVFVKAGETATVFLYPELTQFTRVHLDGTRSAAPGAYTARFGLAESAAHGMGYAEHTFAMA